MFYRSVDNNEVKITYAVVSLMSVFDVVPLQTIGP